MGALKAAVVTLALAYVMPSYSILRRMADSRDKQPITALKVEGTAVISPSSAREVAGLLGVEWVSGELPLSFAVSLRLPGRCRLELSSPQTTKTLAAVSSNGKRRSEGGDLPALTAAIDEICAVLALHGTEDSGESRASVERHLAALKVNAPKTSLGRFHGSVAYVLGDTTEGAPQLWIYKPVRDEDHFTPARVRFTDEKQIRWDVQFVDYTSQASGEWFPRVVAVLKAGEPVLRMTVLKGDGKPKLEDSAF